MSDHDDDLHDPDIRALYRQLPAETPSDATDDAIKAAARRAVGAGPQKTVWTAGRKSAFATAAMVVLTVGLVVQMQRHSPTELHEALDTSYRAAKAPAEFPTEVTTEVTTEVPAQAGSTTEAVAASPATDVASPPARAAKPVAAVPSAEAPRPAPAEPAAAPAPVINSLEEAEADKLADRRDRARDEAIAASHAAQRSANITAPAAAEAKAAAKEESATLQEYRLAKEKKARGTLAASPALASPGFASPTAPAPAASASAQESGAAAPTPPGDYRQLMASHQWAQALQQLARSETPENRNDVARRIDSDLLQQMTAPGGKPGCTALTAAELGDSQVLCDLLSAHAGGKALPAHWRDALTGKKLWQGDFSYRQAALETLLGK